MSKEANRLLSLELALKMKVSKQSIEERVDIFAGFLGDEDDPIRAGCLRLAVEGRTNVARMPAAGVVETAKDYLGIANQTAKPAKKTEKTKRKSKGGFRR